MILQPQKHKNGEPVGWSMLGKILCLALTAYLSSQCYAAIQWS